MSKTSRRGEGEQIFFLGSQKFNETLHPIHICCKEINWDVIARDEFDLVTLPPPGGCYQRWQIGLSLVTCPFGGDTGTFSRSAPGVVNAKGAVRHEKPGANAISISIVQRQADPISAIGLLQAILLLATRGAAAHSSHSILHKLWQVVYKNREITPH